MHVQFLLRKYIECNFDITYRTSYQEFGGDLSV